MLHGFFSDTGTVKIQAGTLYPIPIFKQSPFTNRYTTPIPGYIIKDRRASPPSHPKDPKIQRSKDPKLNHPTTSSSSQHTSIAITNTITLSSIFMPINPPHYLPYRPISFETIHNIGTCIQQSTQSHIIRPCRTLM